MRCIPYVVKIREQTFILTTKSYTRIRSPLISPPHNQQNLRTLKLVTQWHPIVSEDKHKAQEIYLVTDSQLDKVTAQRAIHPVTNTPTKFIIPNIFKDYRPPAPRPQSSALTSKPHKPSQRLPQTKWSPINNKFYQNDSSDDEDETHSNNGDPPDHHLSDSDTQSQPDEPSEPYTPPPSEEPIANLYWNPPETDESRSTLSSLPDMEPTSDQLWL